MTLGRRTAAVVATTAALGTLVAGAIAGSSRSTDAIAMQPTRGPANKGIEKKVDRLVKQGFFEKLFGTGIKVEQDRKAKLLLK